MSKEPKLGATGRYPEGKLRPDDEGELKAAIGTKDGKIFIEFGKPVGWLGISPEQALEFARVLTARANKIIAERKTKN